MTGRGVVGKNYCYQYTDAGVSVFFEDKENNPFMATGAFGTIIDDFNGDNFDHSPLGFIGGGHISAGMSNGRPIGTRATPPGTPRWGKEWKQATAKWYRRWFNVSGTACNYAHRENYLDLDPTYKDALGRPLIRITYNFKENDYKIGKFLSQKAAEIAQAMNPDDRHRAALPRRQLQCRALPVDAQHRRHDHGRRSLDERRQPLSAGLGRAQSVRHGRVRLPAEPELQPDWAVGRARVLVGECDHDASI